MTICVCVCNRVILSLCVCVEIIFCIPTLTFSEYTYVTMDNMVSMSDLYAK